MRFESVTVQGIGPFRRRIAVDLSAIPGLLVAITGENGAGKSTLLECLGGALYRSTPTRGSLAELAVDRNAFVEAKVVNGASYTIRQTLDAISGKGESLVLDQNGASQLPSGKVKEFDAWAAEHLPAPAVLYSSTFAPQGSGGFLELKPGDRKGVLLRVLGIEELEKKAERARDRQRASKQALDVLAARIADERERGGDLSTAADQLAAAQVKADEADENLRLAKAQLEDAEALAARAERALEEVRAKAARSTELRTMLLEILDKKEAVAKRISNNAAVLGERAAIDAAVVRNGEIAQAIERLRADEAALDRKRIVHGKDAGDLAARLKGLESRIDETRGRAERAEMRLRHRAMIETAKAEVPQLHDGVAQGESDVAESAKIVEEYRAATLGVAEKRIGVLRPALVEIAKGPPSGVDPGGSHINDIACDGIFADDQIVTDAASAPVQLAKAEASLRAAERALRDLREKLRSAEALAARMGEIEGAQAERDAATAEVARLWKEVEEGGAAEKDAKAAELETGKRLSILRNEIAALVAEAERVAPLVNKATHLVNAEARLAELSPQRYELEKQQQEVLDQLEGLKPPPGYRTPEPIDIGPQRAHVGTAEQDARHAHGMVKVAEARIESAKLAARKLGEMNAQRSAAETDLADWTLLADSLGRDGLQALEIDAAGPELTELINDLLRTCVGPRWTVTVETTRLSADGKKQLEGCDVRVLDTERGREGTAESLSGGERVLVGEAVSLALSMLACRRSGVKGATLVRDESGAALDPQNARNYVAMLRRAAELVGASHVLFVSHSPDVVDLADARIEIKDGEVTVAP